MPATARLPGAGVELQQRYAGTESLQEACSLLLAEIQEATRLVRMALVVRFQDHTDGVGVGVSPAEMQVLRRALHADAGAGIDEDGAADGSWGDAELPSFRSPRFLPVPCPAAGFSAALVVDAEADRDGLEKARESVRLAAVHLCNAARTEMLSVRLREAEGRQARFRGVLDSLPDPVLVMDAENRSLLVNRRAETLFVTAPSHSPGRRHAIETNNLFFSAFRAKAMLGRDAQPEMRELLLVDPMDGSDLMFEVFSIPFAAPQHAPGLTYVLRDITDLKKASVEMEAQYGRSLAMEHAARQESERLNVIIENVGAPILVTDRQTKVILMNREAERLLDPAAPGTDDRERLRNVRDNDAKLAGLINDFLLQAETRRENRLTLTDPAERRIFPALALSTKISNERHEPTAVITVLHDLTQEVENRHLAEELRQLNAGLEQRVASATRELAERNARLEEHRAQLERASRVKSEFLATMSHELRTPINAMLGYNSLLREGLFGKPTPRQADALERMHAAAGHLLSLINDILDLSMVEAGHLELHPEPIDLERFLGSVSDDIRPLAATKELDYLVGFEPGLGVLEADATRLRQVLLNLLSNAVKFTDAGSIVLRAIRAPGTTDWVRIEVEDTGIGIAENDLGLIFEEFRQIDQSITRQHKGTGLGLAISRKLIALMGGRLGVRSTEGRGSTFHLDLPLRHAS